MTVAPSPVEVREMVARMFRHLRPEHDGEIGETMRVDRGKLVARTYRALDLMAMWLVEIGVVQFYDEEGNMLGTINVQQYYRPTRAAA